MTTGFDSVADALGHQYRRTVLAHLLEHNPLDDADAGMLERASGAPVAGGADHKQTRIALYHTHLPKLEESGYIEWDQDAGTIVKGPEWEEIAPVLELLEQHEHELPVNWH